jgi:cytochrome b561
MYSTMVDDLQSGTTTGDRYDPVSMAFHWATLLLLVAMFWSAWAREGVQDAEQAALLLDWHRSLGIGLWFVTLLRLAWKAGYASAPPLPKTVGRAQALLARGTQVLLYALLIVQPVTGFLQSIWRGKPFALMMGQFPAVAARDKALTHLFHDIHETSATVLLALIALHALAGLFHGLVRRDGVLRSMLPGGVRKNRHGRE